MLPLNRTKRDLIRSVSYSVSWCHAFVCLSTWSMTIVKNAQSHLPSDRLEVSRACAWRLRADLSSAPATSSIADSSHFTLLHHSPPSESCRSSNALASREILFAPGRLCLLRLRNHIRRTHPPLGIRQRRFSTFLAKFGTTSMPTWSYLLRLFLSASIYRASRFKPSTPKSAAWLCSSLRVQLKARPRDYAFTSRNLPATPKSATYNSHYRPKSLPTTGTYIFDGTRRYQPIC
jgi:hypothetical protein